MPPRVAILALLLAPSAGSAPAQTGELPYTAYVAADEAFVRSGPGENYYPTLRLRRGDTVEVYRHDPGGWYAIRPPAGSFSWISAEFVKLLDGGLGVVSGDRVIARVGSQFNDQRDVVQVRLDRGEEVEILEARPLQSPRSDQSWYKIAPPPGEFRWISARFVQRRPPSTASGQPAAEDRLSTSLTAASPADDRSPQSPSRRGHDHAALDDPSHDDPPEQSARDPRPRQRPLPGSPPKSRLVRDFDAELEQLDLDLSTVVAQETDRWDFRQLEDRALDLLDAAETAVVRGRVRLLLNKIARFDDIRLRCLAAGDPPAESRRSQRQPDDRQPPAQRFAESAPDSRPAAEPHVPPPGATQSSASLGRYDGTGRLAQVPAQDVGSPRYALLGADGKVMYYVTPAPGVNLRQYLGRDVGVIGTLGYLTEQQTQHVTAKRIESLDNRWR